MGMRARMRLLRVSGVLIFLGVYGEQEEDGHGDGEF